MQRFLQPASLVLVVEGGVTRELVDSSNKPGRLASCPLSIQLLHLSVRRTDLLQRT